MRWEYKTIRLGTTGFIGGELDEEAFDLLLNKFGADGWELVSTFDTSKAGGTTRDVVAVFKRSLD
jgi:hypothetical protein